MIDEADYGTDQRVRYTDEMNLEFWGLQCQDNPSELKWVKGGLLALKESVLSLGATLGLAMVTIGLTF